MSSPFYLLSGDIPVVWTSPDSIQLGIDPPLATLERVPDGAESLLYALQCGTSESGLLMLARDRGIESEWVESLLSTVDQLGQKASPSHAKPWAIWSVSEAAEGLATLAHYSHFPVHHTQEIADDPSADWQGVLVVADYLIHPHWLDLLARKNLPHIPVVFTDQAVTVGPLVRPGETPCLTCLESGRRDSTPHWLEVSSQLWGKRSPLHSPHTHGVTWAMVMALILHATPNTLETPFPRASYRPEGHQVVWSNTAFHRDCTCRGLDSV
jgi:hypothetical protein